MSWLIHAAADSTVHVGFIGVGVGDYPLTAAMFVGAFFLSWILSHRAFRRWHVTPRTVWIVGLAGAIVLAIPAQAVSSAFEGGHSGGGLVIWAALVGIWQGRLKPEKPMRAPGPPVATLEGVGPASRAFQVRR